jgi:hypothetical protein
MDPTRKILHGGIKVFSETDRAENDVVLNNEIGTKTVERTFARGHLNCRAEIDGTRTKGTTKGYEKGNLGAGLKYLEDSSKRTSILGTFSAPKRVKPVILTTAIRKCFAAVINEKSGGVVGNMNENFVKGKFRVIGIGVREARIRNELAAWLGEGAFKTFLKSVSDAKVGRDAFRKEDLGKPTRTNCEITHALRENDDAFGKHF